MLTRYTSKIRQHAFDDCPYIEFSPTPDGNHVRWDDLAPLLARVVKLLKGYGADVHTSDIDIDAQRLIDDLQNTLKQRDAFVQEQRDRIDELEKRCEAATVERDVFDRMEALMITLQDKLTMVTQRAEAAEEEIERIVTTPLATQLLNANHRLEEKVADLKTQLSTVTQERNALSRTVKAAETSIVHLQDELATLDSNFATAQDEARRLREAIEDLTTGRRGSELHDVGSIMRHFRQALTTPATEGA